VVTQGDSGISGSSTHTAESALNADDVFAGGD
jgi:hypothetical protein